MTQKADGRYLMAVAFGVSLVLAAATLTVFGTGERGTIAALRVTARWSYVFFWPAYTGGALASLFGPLFAGIARRGRELGLSFASAHVTHLSLVGWLYYISPRPPVPTSSLLFFGVAAMFTYALALLSVRRISSMLSQNVWRWVRVVAVEYIALAFLRDFIGKPVFGSALQLIAYLPFLALAIGGTLLRLIALAKRLRNERRAQRALSPAAPGSSAHPGR